MFTNKTKLDEYIPFDSRLKEYECKFLLYTFSDVSQAIVFVMSGEYMIIYPNGHIKYAEYDKFDTAVRIFDTKDIDTICVLRDISVNIDYSVY